MTNPIRRRVEVTEEWFAPPTDTPPPSDLAEADLDDAVDDEDDELDDEEQDDEEDE